MIELKGITKDYGSKNNVVRALKGIDLSFRENEFVAILGPSGGGKTTLLNIIGGLDKYTDGDLIINGKSTAKYTDKDWDTYRNHSVGFVFQSYNLISHQTVLSNVELALTISGVDKKVRKEKAIEVLEKVGLGEHIYKKPNQLSGGQMQRVAIARALINDPDILLADEPTGALDSKTSVQIMELLKEVAKDKLVVMVTHNPELATEYANRIVRLSDGEILSDSNPYMEEKTSIRENKSGKARMRFSTALSLSLNNLWTKKARTILVGFAGSIGIIGIALILSLSNGVNDYIDEVQENSLSSYPLSIEYTTADFSSAITAMMGTIETKEEIEGSVVEVPVMDELAASTKIGVNNLSKLREYLLENEETVFQWVSDIQYSYSVDLNIYRETGDEVVQVNPSAILSSMMSYYSSYYSYGNAFFEIIGNQDLLDSQYEVLAGSWPTSYDELVLVLPDKYAVSDYTLYSLGLKDMDEFIEIIRALITDGEASYDSDPLVFSYDELLNLEYKLVLPTNLYQYDEKYNIWIDKSEDEEFLKNAVSNGLTLKITAVVAPKDGVSSTALSSGIGYTHELVEWEIAESSKTEIVQAQLKNEDIDVFSGKTFEEVNGSTETESSLDFESLISLDEEKLASAFGGNFNQQELETKITEYVTSAMNSIVVDDAELADDILEDFSSRSGELVSNYINKHGNGTSARFDEDDIDDIVSEYMATCDFSDLINKYSLSEEMLEPFYTQMLNALLTAYYETASSVSISGNQATLTKTTFSAYYAVFIAQDEVQSGIETYAKTLCEARIKINVALVMADLSTGLITEISNSMNIDADVLAQAFTFNMSEEDLTNIMSTMSGTKSSASQYSNLISLGYQDIDSPSSISFYFSDFASKDLFKDYLDEYNNAQEEAGLDEDVIVYTDVVGILMSSIQSIINAISYVLIAFVSVSLIVSSAMIGIITYISVIERTKEIGILRAIGASKSDVGNVFNAETFIIGLLSGVLGVGISMLLNIVISIIVRNLTNIPSLTASLSAENAVILILISVVLTLIAGLIPSGKASKCDPVIALRTE